MIWCVPPASRFSPIKRDPAGRPTRFAGSEPGGAEQGMSASEFQECGQKYASGLVKNRRESTYSGAALTYSRSALANSVVELTAVATPLIDCATALADCAGELTDSVPALTDSVAALADCASDLTKAVTE